MKYVQIATLILPTAILCVVSALSIRDIRYRRREARNHAATLNALAQDAAAQQLMLTTIAAQNHTLIELVSTLAQPRDAKGQFAKPPKRLTSA